MDPALPGLTSTNLPMTNTALFLGWRPGFALRESARHEDLNDVKGVLWRFWPEYGAWKLSFLYISWRSWARMERSILGLTKDAWLDGAPLLHVHLHEGAADRRAS